MLTENEKSLLNDYFKRWEEFAHRYNPNGDHPGLTKRLEKMGQEIYQAFESKSIADVSQLRRFLEEIGEWKMPWDRGKHIRNVNGNSDTQILNAFKYIVTVPSDETRISACTTLKGFGQGEGPRPQRGRGEKGGAQWRNLNAHVEEIDFFPYNGSASKGTCPR
jgi:hypothetical protein